MTERVLKVYRRGTEHGDDDLFSTKVTFYAVPLADGKEYVRFEGHVSDLEGDPININGSADEFDIDTDGFSYLKLNSGVLAELQKIMDTAHTLKRKLRK